MKLTMLTEEVLPPEGGPGDWAPSWPTMTSGREKFQGRIIDNPFLNSKITQEMYHGSHTPNITKFNRPPEGVWFAEYPEWCEGLYCPSDDGDYLYACWLNVKNPYYPTEDEALDYYGEMEIIGEFFDELRKLGYDSYIQGGESGSVAVFETVEIVNALTGKPM